ncbi:hypothetical protein BG006_000646 [Podila minutissima]|uniref:Uncharacterized protein n=1 Tax=Podila minutissima TaxID=64525 RepID=A0A9P5SER0_9FUNG|nr:hypothetical protein BG006_000646 [Podila minutissima]
MLYMIQVAGVDGANEPIAGAAVGGEEEDEEEAGEDEAGQSDSDSDVSSESGSDSSGSGSEEDEDEGPAAGRRRYSRFTVKAYAKFRSTSFLAIICAMRDQELMEGELEYQIFGVKLSMVRLPIITIQCLDNSRGAIQCADRN